eukprot:4343358-Amphidinium_carterae.1
MGGLELLTAMFDLANWSSTIPEEDPERKGMAAWRKKNDVKSMVQAVLGFYAEKHEAALKYSGKLNAASLVLGSWGGQKRPREEDSVIAIGTESIA